MTSNKQGFSIIFRAGEITVMAAMSCGHALTIAKACFTEDGRTCTTCAHRDDGHSALSLALAPRKGTGCCNKQMLCRWVIDELTWPSTSLLVMTTRRPKGGAAASLVAASPDATEAAHTSVVCANNTKIVRTRQSGIIQQDDAFLAAVWCRVPR